jgi:hypothetical protein
MNSVPQKPQGQSAEKHKEGEHQHKPGEQHDHKNCSHAHNSKAGDQHGAKHDHGSKEQQNKK